MKTKLKNAADHVLARSPAQPLFRWRAERRLTVLAYHRVSDPGRFAEHIDYLTKSFHPVALQDVEAAVARRAGLPRKALLVTFDDGDRSHLDLALPVLARSGVPAVVFVVAGLLGEKRAFWWEEVEQLWRRGARADGVDVAGAPELIRWLKQLSDARRRAVVSELKRGAPEVHPAVPHLAPSDLPKLEADGIVVGNHSFDHPCLTRCSHSESERQIRESHKILEAALGKVTRTFAYPNGDHDSRAEALLREMGYDTAFLFDHRISDDSASAPLRISRLRIDTSNSLERLRIVSSGLHPAIHAVRSRVSGRSRSP